MSEKQRLRPGSEFNPGNLLWRFAAVLFLVCFTYNPTRASYVSWLRAGFRNDNLGPEHFVVGMVLIIGWAILIVATKKSLGPIGLGLAAALIGGVVWWLSDLGIGVVGSLSVLTWVILFCLSILLTIGLSWSHVWRRLTGQYEVDDNDT
jgi:hypothetical protein